MKKQTTFSAIGIFYLCMLACLNVFSQNNTNPGNAQINSKTTMQELIIGVPKASDKNLFILTGAIADTKGLEFVKFCPVHNLLLIKYDNTKFAKNEDILTVFTQKNIIMPMFIKEGKFDDVKDLCDRNE